ncbi:MAG: sugar phosphate isomerase/epimerase [Bacteroidetes bacterium]|nr:sugar phosphate isomerase/epimerase [Bacteroidota bacterium]
MQLTFGVSTWLWVSPFTTKDAFSLFAKIRNKGFDMVEIAVEDPALIDTIKIKEALNAYGLSVVVCGAFGADRDISGDDKTVQQNAINYIKECIDIAAQIGAPVFGGPMYSAVGKARMVSSEQRKKEWNTAVNNLSIVAEIAASSGIRLALEPLNRFESDMVNTAADAIRMVNEINNPAVGIGLDGFHTNIEEPDIEKAILTAGDKLFHVQVAENYRGAPGTGQTNWMAWRRGLEKINYNGAISIESFTPDNVTLAGAVCIWKKLAENQDIFARDGLKFLKEVFENFESV